MTENGKQRNKAAGAQAGGSSPCLLGQQDPGIDPAYGGEAGAQALGLQAANTILYCRRWRETMEFYRQVIGLQASHALDWFVEFHLGGQAFLSIADAARSSIEAGEGRGITVALRVRDLRAAHRLLSQRGAGPTPIKTHSWGAKVFYLRDPEGNRLEFWAEE